MVRLPNQTARNLGPAELEPVSGLLRRCRPLHIGPDLSENPVQLERKRLALGTSLCLVGIFLSIPCLAAFGDGRGLRIVKGLAGPEASGPPVSTFSIPEPTAYPLGIATDGAGHVWFAEDNTDAIVELVRSSSIFETFNIPTQHHLAWIWFMVFDGDGNLWFADESQQLIWRFNPATGTFANFTAGSAYPFALHFDTVRSRMWFTSLKTGQVGYFVIRGGEAKLGPLANLSAPIPGTGVSGIEVDPSGNAYVAESFQAKIVELNGSTLSEVREWRLPTGTQPVGLALDAARGRLWFTNHASSFFGYVGLGSGGYVEYSTSLVFSGGSYEVSLPYWIDVSSSGYVWFNEHIANRIARFDPGLVQLTEFDIPTGNSSPLMLALDDERGAVWFTEFAGNAVGMVQENSSLDQKVQVSVQTVDLNPSSSFTAAPEPIAPAPSVGLTAVSTGAPEPDFAVSTKASDGAYQVGITTHQAKPGNYTGSVCFLYPRTNQCGYLMVIVAQPGSTLSLLYAVYAAAGAGVAILVLALLRESKRERERRRTGRL